MGARPASADDDDTVWLWDAASGEQMGLLQGHTRWVRAVVFSQDGRQLAFTDFCQVLLELNEFIYVE